MCQYSAFKGQPLAIAMCKHLAFKGAQTPTVMYKYFACKRAPASTAMCRNSTVYFIHFSWFKFSPRLKSRVIWSLTNNWLVWGRRARRCQSFFACSSMTWTVFYLNWFSHLFSLLSAVAIFAETWMMNYLLLLQIFLTSTVSARWGQLWLIQPQTFSKKSLVGCFCM